MKKVVLFVGIIILVLLCTSVLFAQKPKSKEDALKEIATLTNSKNPEEKEKGYELSKEFLTRFGKDKDPVIAKLRNFVNAYSEGRFFKAIDDKKYKDAFSYGKEILAERPDFTEGLLCLAYAGYEALTSGGDKSYSNESMMYARKAIQLIDAGTLPNSFAPFKNKEEATAWLYYIDASFSKDNDKKASAVSFYRSTLYDSPIKNNTVPYLAVAYYYEDVYEKLSTELKAKVDSKTVSDADSKKESENVNKVIDLILDSYVRAWKRADAENSPEKTQVKDRLAQVYKFRKKTAEGLPEFINYIESLPMPDPSKM